MKKKKIVFDGVEMKSLKINDVDGPDRHVIVSDVLETVQDGKFPHTTRLWVQIEVNEQRKVGLVHNMVWLNPERAKRLGKFLIERAEALVAKT